jgi:glutaminyl-peptide cyclotransferase
MRTRAVCLALLLSGAVCACRHNEAPRPIEPALVRFDAQQAFQEVSRFLEQGPRVAGTPGAARAARYLMGRLRSLGVAADLDEFTDAAPVGPTTFRNVIGRIAGTGAGTVILCAHYDTKSGIEGFQGANDSGSGVGLLLALAAAFQKGPQPAVSLEFVFFDGEECAVSYGPHDGLHGSRHLASQLAARKQADSVRAVILLDMIGDRDLSVTIPRNGTPRLMSAALGAAREEGCRSKFGLYAAAILDDHEPFLDAGMPAIDLIDFEFGSQPGRNDYWHTPADTLDKISPASLDCVGRVTIRLVRTLR